jgi:hypothetical protein
MFHSKIEDRRLSRRLAKKTKVALAQLYEPSKPPQPSTTRYERVVRNGCSARRVGGILRAPLVRCTAKPFTHFLPMILPIGGCGIRALKPRKEHSVPGAVDFQSLGITLSAPPSRTVATAIALAIEHTQSPRKIQIHDLLKFFDAIPEYKGLCQLSQSIWFETRVLPGEPGRK